MIIDSCARTPPRAATATTITPEAGIEILPLCVPSDRLSGRLDQGEHNAITS
jgi:hypothetical protein